MGKWESGFKMNDIRPRMKVDAKDRVTIPKEICEKQGVKKGSILEFEIYGKDKILMTVLLK